MPKTCIIEYYNGHVDTIVDTNPAELDFPILNAKNGGIVMIEFRFDGRCIGTVLF